MEFKFEYKKLWQKLIFLGLPFLLWIFFFRDFITGQIYISEDTFNHFTITKYFINNLLNGVVPLWEPFIFLGRPFLFLVGSGLTTPPVFIIIGLKSCGIDYYHAYLIYLVLYYFIGLLGFFLLAKKIFNHELYAWLAYVFLLFSGMGIMVFNQIFSLFVFYPAVWFFYFFISFIKSFKKSDFLGTTASLVILFGSYTPFYFTTLFILFLLHLIILYPKQFIEKSGRTLIFLKNNIFLTIICITAILISIIPLYLFNYLDKNHELISPARHSAACLNKEPACFEGSKMQFNEVSFGGSLMERVNIQRIFSHLNKAKYNVDDFFYLPFLVYIIILISFFTLFDRFRLLLLSLIVCLFLISMGAGTPFHKLLYDHVFYFKYFRNFFFFMTILMPLIVLFSVSQLKAMVEQNQHNVNNNFVLWNIFIFILPATLFLLYQQGDILITTHITLLLSVIFFGFFLNGKFSPKKFLFWITLFTLTIIEPGEVFYHYKKSAENYTCSLPINHVIPKFSYTRTADLAQNTCTKILRDEKYYFKNYLTLADSDGHWLQIMDVISKWSYTMHWSIDPEIIRKYSRNKFILYDQIIPWSEIPNDNRIEAFSNVVLNNADIAFISIEENENISKAKSLDLANIPGKAQAITEDSENFKILNFNVNSLKLLTNFPQRKFLVYNDGYTINWMVHINGKKEKIFRSNIAFKGFWLPAGKNIVDLKYSPPGGEWIYIFVMIFELLFLAYTLKTIHKNYEN